MKRLSHLGTTRSVHSRSTRDAAEIIIDKFVASPVSPEIKQKAKRKSTRASVSVLTLYANLNSNVSQYLPVNNTSGISPFQFHSTHNGDSSYITSPRLLVTKMLVNQWCQLRDFYRVFASSPRIAPTRLMQMGSEEHLRLETSTHPVVSVESPQLPMGVMPFLYEANAKESETAGTIAESILFRLYSLFVTSEAREIRVHSYINLQDLHLEAHKLSENSVLVNGVIDVIELKDKDDPEGDFSMIEELNAYIPNYNVPIIETYNEGEHIPEPEISEGDAKYSLTSFIEEVRQMSKIYAGAVETVVGDVKTRSILTIPAQQSVVDAAKFQVFYYLKFLKILALSGKTYQSLLDSWELRRVDLDAPINYHTLFVMLKKYGSVIYDDMERLAKGIPLGVEDFDNVDHKNTQYDPGECFPKHEREHPLLRPWKKPLTLRYFIARSAQFYELLGPFLSPNCKVEYRNVRTHRVIATKRYVYNDTDLQSQIVQACLFWNGKSDPRVNEDLSRCKNCEFRAHCVVPHRAPPLVEDQQNRPSEPKIGEIILTELLQAKM